MDPTKVCMFPLNTKNNVALWTVFPRFFPDIGLLEKAWMYIYMSWKLRTSLVYAVVTC